MQSRAYAESAWLARPARHKCQQGSPLCSHPPAPTELFHIDRRSAVHILRNMLDCPTILLKINAHDLRSASSADDRSAHFCDELPTQGLNELNLDVADVLCAIVKHDPCKLHRNRLRLRYPSAACGRKDARTAGRRTSSQCRGAPCQRRSSPPRCPSVVARWVTQRPTSHGCDHFHAATHGITWPHIRLLRKLQAASCKPRCASQRSR